MEEENPNAQAEKAKTLPEKLVKASYVVSGFS
jgi:hypothetical protein